jgi:hypothetical protein
MPQNGHAGSELESVVDDRQEVKMVRQERETAEADSIESLCASEDADHEVVELRAGPEKETAVKGSAGDLDEASAFGDVA